MLGRSHDLVRRLRRLRRDATARRAEGVVVAEGSHLLGEALASAPGAIECVVHTARLERDAGGRALLAACRRAGLVVHETGDAVMDGLQEARSPQPVLALVRFAPADPRRCLAGADGPLAIAAGLQDPGNLGAILRTADAAGAVAAAVCGPGADPRHPRAVRATMGAIFRLPLIECAVDGALDLAAEHGMALVGADADGDVECFDYAWPERVALVLGGEGAGLPPEARVRLDAIVRVPMRRGVESLSVGAAAAVLLFDIARRRRPRPR